ncbi:MAG: hypothetical protein IT580_12325 [Verrucomicrobiales bacterium]|nr:hypothetical protein [Verrucomicrobiales bacterium]
MGLLLLLLLPGASRAEMQFDVFMGYDDLVREGNWFPVAFELFNDGPPVTGTVVLAPDGAADSQSRTFSIELPTSTRKRVVIPVFAPAGRYSRWEARLLGPDGKILAERDALQPKDVAGQVPILGALPRTFGGLPTFPEVKNRPTEFLPAVARLQPDYLPANPLALEGLTAWYLNSEKAAELKPDQADALLAWVHGGGHLIVAIEQPNDVTALPWLRALLPFAPEGATTRPMEGAFERWLVSGKPALQLPSVLRRTGAANPRANRPGRVNVQTPASAEPADPFANITTQNDFNNADLPVVTGKIGDGTRVLSLGDQALIVSAARGQGMVTALAFSPEREPFRGWKNRPWFWAKLTGVPAELLTESSELRYTGGSVDAIFGAMLDSRQVRKLPVAALLLLLVVYLVVIGPFDQWILKRSGRQMWTWVTFPVYVILFSALIYFIGYRLRAGDLEWNEIQVVDQLPRGEEAAALRGRTWISIYSPANQRYRFASDQPFAMVRPEMQRNSTTRGDSSRLNITLPAAGFLADAFIPVWVNQLYASDWIQPAPRLLTATLVESNDQLEVTVENPSELTFSSLQLTYQGRIHTLPQLAPHGHLAVTVSRGEGRPIDELLQSLPHAMQVSQQRQQAFGGAGSGQLDRILDQVLMLSFSQRNTTPNQGYGDAALLTPAGFDLSNIDSRGDAVVFAWATSQTLTPSIHRFAPTRAQRDTVVRTVVPVSRRP